MEHPEKDLFSTILFACLGLISLTGCDHDDEGPYDYGYYPAGVVGQWCRSNVDCYDGFCCTTKACGNGMCSYNCRDSRDCPSGSLCEANTCFLACRTEFDCLTGQHCTPGNVCHY
jgi:hypothetical protein